MTSRRKVLTILAGAAALPLVGTSYAKAAIPQWKGIALGAEARIILDHPNAEKILPQAVAEIRRLENIFSLYQPDSQLSHLNRHGFLNSPSLDMIELLSICSHMNAKTKGAFDPTVQSLWELYANHAVLGRSPNAAQISGVMKNTGWHMVRYSPEKVWVDQAEVRLTLNGIAQGFIADKVSDLLQGMDVRNVLVNTGEIVALGGAPDGNNWTISIGQGQASDIGLKNQAISTSEPLGTAFDTNGQVGHIIDPRDGYPKTEWSKVTVIADKAANADALSTAFCLMSRAEIEAAQGDHRVHLS